MAERRNHPGLDPMAPHALDHDAYAAGVPVPERMLQLEHEDAFWRTLGGNRADPFGDDGETFRQRRRAMQLGIGTNIYGPMGYRAADQSQNSDS